MVKKISKNSKIKTQSNSLILKNSLSLISPLKFTSSHQFIYNIKFYKEFRKFVNNYDCYKTTEEELLFLKTNIENINKSFSYLSLKNNSNFVCQYFQLLFPYITKIEEIKSSKTKLIEDIMRNYRLQGQISLLKIKEILMMKYNINLSKSTIYRILKNKLKYRYKKTVVKNRDLNNLKYKIISFIFIKIIVRAMKLNMNFIFIDESNFSLTNNHFKTWRKFDDNVNYGPKTKSKINIILAVSINRVINYQLTTENINIKNFEIFLIDTINKININELNNTIFILDNLSVHCSKTIIKLMKKKKLKVLFTVPYQSSFNPIELSFRHIKNKIYKKIYLNINNLKNDVLDILKENNLKETLFKNFIETIEKYISFIIKNKLLLLEENKKV